MASWAEGAEWFGILTTSATSAVSSIISFFLSSWWWKHYENFKQQYIPFSHNLGAEERVLILLQLWKAPPHISGKSASQPELALLSYYRRGSNSETWRPVWTMKPRLHFVHPKCSYIWDPRIHWLYSDWEIETATENSVRSTKIPLPPPFSQKWPNNVFDTSLTPLAFINLLEPGNTRHWKNKIHGCLCSHDNQ